MASIELPNLNNKEFWRNTRLLFWSFIVTVAILDFANVITIPEYFAGLTMLTYIVAGWVVAYHLIKRWRG